MASTPQPYSTPRTYSAMDRLGIVKDDLIPKSSKDFIFQCKGNTQLAKKAAQFFQTRRERMLEMIQKERDSILQEEREKAESSGDGFTPTPLLKIASRHKHLNENADKQRRASVAVNNARKQVVQQQEAKSKIYDSLTRRREERIKRMNERKAAELEQRKREHLEREMEKRERIEESRHEVLVALHERKSLLDEKYSQRLEAREEFLQQERERLAKEREAEEQRRQEAFEKKQASVQIYVESLERTLSQKDEELQERLAAERSKPKSKLLSIREQRLHKAQLLVQQQLQEKQAQHIQEMEKTKEKTYAAKEKLGKVLRDYLDRRAQRQREANEKIHMATVTHENMVEQARSNQIKAMNERDVLVNTRKEELKKTWTDRSFEKFVKTLNARDNLARARSQELHKLETRRKNMEEKWRLIEERNNLEAELRNEDIMRRKARNAPDISTTVHTPGPGHYIGTDSMPWVFSGKRGCTIHPMVGASLPPYPTPSPSMYSPRPEYVLPHKGSPVM
eukprot:PhF_6_TR2163/c0_g1_i2/m.3523